MSRGLHLPLVGQDEPFAVLERHLRTSFPHVQFRWIARNDGSQHVAYFTDDAALCLRLEPDHTAWCGKDYSEDCAHGELLVVAPTAAICAARLAARYAPGDPKPDEGTPFGGTADLSVPQPARGEVPWWSRWVLWF